MSLGIVSANGDYLFAENTDVLITPEAQQIILEAQEKYGKWPRRERREGDREKNRRYLEALANIDIIYKKEESPQKFIVFIRNIIPDSKMFILKHYEKNDVVPSFLWRIRQYN